MGDHVGGVGDHARIRIRDLRGTFAEVTGTNPVEALIFFRLFLSGSLKWKINSDYHS